MLFRCQPCAGPPAVAAINDDMPSNTRNPLSPTAATHKLSAAASAIDPQLSSVVVKVDDDGSGNSRSSEVSNGRGL